MTSVQRRGGDCEGAEGGATAPASPTADVDKVRAAPGGGRRALKITGAVLALGAVSLCAQSGSLLSREPLRPRYAEPVDRSHALQVSGNGPVPSGRVISVADLSRRTMGSAHEAAWPLFWVMTAPQYEQTRCQEILATWGKAVPPDSLVFIGSETNWTTRTGYRFITLPVPREMKAAKEFLSWQYVARAFPDREWYVKGDDDTYFIVGNLNRYLEAYDPRLPYYLGCKFHLGGPGGVQYVSGGAGYVLSKVSAHRLADATDQCLRYYGRVGEGDIAIAECLQTLGVVPEDTRDERGRQRFHAFPLDYHLNWYRYGFHVSRFWYHDWVWGPEIEGSSCCDDNTTVSFHYMADKMLKFSWPGAKKMAPLGMQGGPGLGSAPTLAPAAQLPGQSSQPNPGELFGRGQLSSAGALPVAGGLPGGFLSQPGADAGGAGGTLARR